MKRDVQEISEAYVHWLPKDKFLGGGAATTGAIAINQNTSRGNSIRNIYRKFQKSRSVGCQAMMVHMIKALFGGRGGNRWRNRNK